MSEQQHRLTLAFEGALDALASDPSNPRLEKQAIAAGVRCLAVADPQKELTNDQRQHIREKINEAKIRKELESKRRLEEARVAEEIAKMKAMEIAIDHANDLFWDFAHESGLIEYTNNGTDSATSNCTRPPTDSEMAAYAESAAEAAKLYKSKNIKIVCHLCWFHSRPDKDTETSGYQIQVKIWADEAKTWVTRNYAPTLFPKEGKARQRLIALREMFVAKLISLHEYDRKREEIIEEL